MKQRARRADRMRGIDSRLWSIGLAAAVCGASWSGQARADGPRAGAEAGTEEHQEQLAAAAFEAYKKGDDTKAIALYVRAYNADPAKGTSVLFNIASIYDKKLKEPALASEFYRRYLAAPDAEPEAAGRAAERLKQLRVQIANDAASAAALPAPTAAPAAAPPADQPAQTAVTPPPSDLPPPRTSPWQIGTLVAGGVGIATLGVGLIFGLSAKSKNDSASKACNGGTTCVDPSGIQLTQDARSAAGISTVACIGGGALIAVSTSLLLLAPWKTGGPASASASAWQVTPAIGRDVAGMELKIVLR